MPDHTIPAIARITLLSIATVSGCAADPPAPALTDELSRESPRAPRVEHRPALAEPFAAASYEGVFIVLDPAHGSAITSDPKLAERRFIPASTFKIPNSLIALETGVADSPGFALAWDGVERGYDWDRDHDLRSAFRVSAVWFYQELARRIGEQRMREWLVAADYGNADIAGGVDMFWLNGALRISPREQVEFLRRLHEGDSPFAPEVVRVFLDEVMIDEQREGVTIRAKTGWARSQDFVDPNTAGFDGNLGWFVGSVEQADGSRVYFALLLLAPEPAPETFSGDRRELAGMLLRQLGYLE
jgi:beta-lactamase class D